jgi:hypothetical protein
MAFLPAQSMLWRTVAVRWVVSSLAECRTLIIALVVVEWAAAVGATNFSVWPVSTGGAT